MEIYIPTCLNEEFTDADEQPEIICLKTDINDSNGNFIGNFNGFAVYTGWSYYISEGSYSDKSRRSINISKIAPRKYLTIFNIRIMIIVDNIKGFKMILE